MNRIIVSKEEAERLRHEILHPNEDALRKRDAFLESLPDMDIKYEEDGGFSFKFDEETKQ